MHSVDKRDPRAIRGCGSHRSHSYVRVRMLVSPCNRTISLKRRREAMEPLLSLFLEYDAGPEYGS